jgi:hypothetical protein
VLLHLGAADEEQARFRTEYPPYDLPHVPGTLAPAAWSTHLIHKEMDPRLTAIFRIVAPTILKMRYQAIPAGERARFLGAPLHADVSPIAARVVMAIENAAEILGLPMPELFERPAMPVPLSIAPAPGPALFVSLDAAASIPDDLLNFLIARRLAELRPELTAHALFPTVGELKSLHKASVRAALAGPKGEGAKPQEIALAKALEKRELELLREAVSSVIGVGQHLDIRRWVQLADVTMSRVGLLLAGDIDVAWRALQRETRSPGDLALSESRAEMLAYAVSDEYSELRGAIGVAIEAIDG